MSRQSVPGGTSVHPRGIGAHRLLRAPGSGHQQYVEHSDQAQRSHHGLLARVQPRPDEKFGLESGA